MKLRPLFASERYGAAPFRNCRGSSIFFCVMVATANEGALNAFGRQVGLGGRTKMLRQMWQAFEAQTPADDNGWADQGDVYLMQRAVWPDLPLPVKVTTSDADAVWDAIGANAISLAIDTGAVPASDPIRRYVGDVMHQGVAWKKRVRNGVRQVKWVCPMHPPSNTYTGHWVDWSSLRKAAKAVPLSLAGAPGGRFIYEVYPAGKWTDAALTEASMARRIGKKNNTIERQKDRIIEQDHEIARLEIELLECKEDGDCDAVRVATIDQVEEAIAEAIAGVRDDAA